LRVWSPKAQRVEVRLFAEGGRHATRTEAMHAVRGGRFEIRLLGVGAGSLHKFVLDGRELPFP
jgi:1,4-alpha-glucan branching enzyme